MNWQNTDVIHMSNWPTCTLEATRNMIIHSRHPVTCCTQQWTAIIEHPDEYSRGQMSASLFIHPKQTVAEHAFFFRIAFLTEL